MKLYKEALRSFFSGYVSALRRRRGLTQEEMAERLRITGRAYSDLERGHILLFRGCAGVPSAHAGGARDQRAALVPAGGDRKS